METFASVKGYISSLNWQQSELVFK